MRRLLFAPPALIGLTLIGCGSPTNFLRIPAGSAAKTIAAGETSAAAANPVRTVVYQQPPASEADPEVYYDDPAIAPDRPYSPPNRGLGEAPVQAGDVFVPPPAIPPAPGVVWDMPQTPAAAPLTLGNAESLACGNNPTLLQARAEVQGSLGKAIQAGLWPNPTLVYRAEQIGVEGTPGEFHGGLVRQRIVTAHKLDLSREKFRARTRTAEWVALGQQYRVLNDVRIHYFRARGRQESLQVQRELLKNAEDQVVTTRELYNVGQATMADVHDANVVLQRQRLELLMAENDLQQAFEELTALVGVDLPPAALETPLAGELAVIPWGEALARLREESPQVCAARAKLAADRITIRREIAEPVPDIVLEGGAGYNFEAGETVGAAAVMMEMPLYDWNQGTIRQAEADFARQEGEVRRTELSLRRQLAAEYRNYLVAVRNVQSYEAVILPAARAAYDLRLQSYEVDRIRWTDVLESEREYFLLRQQHILNLVAWREHETSIMGFLLHGGLEPPPNPTPPGHIDADAKPR